MGTVRSQEFEGQLRAVVVDNSQPPATDSRLDALAKEDHFDVVVPPENLGYFGGAAYGFDHFVAGHGLPDWVIVSNPDILLEDKRFFDKLCILHRDTHCAMIAPGIMSRLTGDNQNPYMKQRPGKSITSFREQIARNVLVFNAYELLSHAKRGLRGIFKRSRRLLTDAVGDVSKIYAPHGSFIIFNKAYFEAGGSLEYEPFLYGEENYVAEIARQLNLPVFYDPRLQVTHQEHATTGLLKSKAMVSIIHDARSYLYNRFYLTSA
jgi:GT2 family glycosyltransferase